jgi:TolB-like protein
VLIPAVELFDPGPPPKIALTARLVTTDPHPQIRWAHGVARTGDDDPGFLMMGTVLNVTSLVRKAVPDLAVALAAHLEGRSRLAPNCPSERRYAPRVAFRAPILDDRARRTVAVLPFQNLSTRRDAGDLVVLEFVRQLSETGAFEVVEPGVVRSELLGLRLILEGGVSLDTAQLVLEHIGADLVLSGTVHDLEETAGRLGTPKVDFTAYLLDRDTGELVWSSSSRNQGDDGVWFFGVGTLHSASQLACRMTRAAVEKMAGARGLLGPAPTEERTRSDKYWRWSARAARDQSDRATGMVNVR